MRRVLTACAALLLATSAHAASVKLAWDAPAVGVPDSYVMYRQVGSGQFELLATIPAASLTYVDTTAVLGTNCYHVTASNAGGESAPSNAVCFQAVSPPTPPQALRFIP